MKKGLVKIKRAIISVSNKDGLEELALRFKSWDIELIASGGTAKILKEKSIEVIEVEDLTGFPEILEGRVKSLHPNIHGGILAIRDNPIHISDLTISIKNSCRISMQTAELSINSKPQPVNQQK